jgi:hypothetical protein
MISHGRRRAAEMAEACETLRSLRIAPMLTEGTVGWQEGIGELEITPVPEGLSAKLAAIAAKREELGA